MMNLSVPSVSLLLCSMILDVCCENHISCFNNNSNIFEIVITNIILTNIGKYNDKMRKK